MEKIKFENFNNDLPIYPISVAAQLLNISVHTLRMYEREGLIIPHKKKSNQRLYSKVDLERIQCIRKAINESKISINGIKTIYSLIPCWELVKCSEEDKKNVQLTINMINHVGAQGIRILYVKKNIAGNVRFIKITFNVAKLKN